MARKIVKSYDYFYYRAVYDDDELGKFVELLDSRIKSHDTEIERMCNFHYQGFIDSVRELLQVSTDAAHLRVSTKIVLFLTSYLL